MQYLQRIQSCGKRSVKHAAADLHVSEIIGSTDTFDNRGRAERAVLQVSFRRTFAVFAELHQCMAGHHLPQAYARRDSELRYRHHREA